MGPRHFGAIANSSHLFYDYRSRGVEVCSPRSTFGTTPANQGTVRIVEATFNFSMTFLCWNRREGTGSPHTQKNPIKFPNDPKQHEPAEWTAFFSCLQQLNWLCAFQFTLGAILPFIPIVFPLNVIVNQIATSASSQGK